MRTVQRSIRTAALPLVAAIVALGCVAGCGGAPAAQRATVTVAVRTTPSAPPVSGTRGTVTVTVVAAPVPTISPSDAKRAPGRADETEFWRLIAQTRSAADNDTGRQSGLLEDRLTELSPQAIIEFARI